jgi:hypothetical protein
VFAGVFPAVFSGADRIRNSGMPHNQPAFMALLPVAKVPFQMTKFFS